MSQWGINAEDNMAREAASIIEENIVACRRTLTVLLKKQPKALKEQHAGSFLRGAVKYLVYDIESRPIIESGLKEIEDRIKSMEIALRFIETDYLFDIHSVVGSDARRPSLAPILVLPDSKDGGPDDDVIFNRTKMETDTGADTSQFSLTLKHSIDKMDVDTIQEMLEHNHDPLAQDKDGWCALHYAGRTNSKPVCQILIDSKRIRESPEGIDRLNHTGATPLHFAASIGSSVTVQVLLCAGANPNTPDHYNRSPLFMAGEGNHLRVIKLLLDSEVEIPSDSPTRLKEIQRAIHWRNRRAKKLRAKGRIC